jgi:hypothetical protein
LIYLQTSCFHGPGYKQAMMAELFCKIPEQGSDHPKTLHHPTTFFWAMERNEYNPVATVLA